METLSEWFSFKGDELPTHEPGKDPYQASSDESLPNAVEETQELIQKSLQQLNEALENAPDDEKKEWLEANNKCNEDQIDDKHKLLFLRAARFDIDEAATKLLWYWKRRVAIFGDNKAFLPLVLSGALKDDSVALSTGFLRVLENVRDPVGRSVIFADPSRQRPDTYERLSMVRVFWYTMHIAVQENEASQKHGVIFVGFPKNAQLSQFDRTLVNLNTNSLKAALPIRMAAVHICHPPAFFSIVFPIVRVLLGAYLRNVVIHSGTQEQVLERLSHFGFDSGNLPTELGGEMVLDIDEWLERRRSRGL